MGKSWDFPGDEWRSELTGLKCKWPKDTTNIKGQHVLANTEIPHVHRISIHRQAKWQNVSKSSDENRLRALRDTCRHQRSLLAAGLESSCWMTSGTKRTTSCLHWLQLPVSHNYCHTDGKKKIWQRALALIWLCFPPVCGHILNTSRGLIKSISKPLCKLVTLNSIKGQRLTIQTQDKSVI